MVYAIVVLCVLILDQAVKYWVLLNIAPEAAIPFIPGFIELTNHHNTGAAFGILENGRWFFVAVTVVFTAVVIFLISKKIIKTGLGRLMLVLVLAGGLGNGIDRAINGYVIDMFRFEFMRFAIFNVADIFITVCGLLFCVHLLFHKETPGEERESGDEEPQPPVRPSSRAGRNKNPVSAPDYIYQLQNPGAVTEPPPRQTAEPPPRAAGPRPRAPEPLKKSSEPFTDPFAEFSPAPLKPAQAPAPARPVHGESAGKAPAPDIPAKAPEAPASPVPAKPAPAGKGGDGEYSLDDIIAEFK